ncbi:MAG: NADH:flavin oxidoreductase [Peptococcaceae bacterium]
MESYKNLFSSIKIQQLTLKNRITAAAMTLNWVDNEGFVDSRVENFYVKVARGGAGLIIFEATSISSKRRSPNNRTMAVYDDKFIPGLRQVVEKIHAEGTVVFLQLHDGLVSTKRSPEDLAQWEIEEIKNDFIEAAKRAQQAGFDGVEIHMVHRGTLADFLSKMTNNRTDNYGRSIQGRTRLAAEVIVGIKEACGESFPVSCRILGDEFMIGGNTPKDSSAIAAILEANGADIISLSAGGRVKKRDNNLTTTLPDEYSYWRAWPTAEWPDATNAYLGEEIKKTVRIPVMVAGKIGNPVVAEEVLLTKKADLVAMGRAIVADPYLPVKVLEGNWESVVRCTYCKYCRQEVRAGRSLSCILWNHVRN